MITMDSRLMRQINEVRYRNEFDPMPLAYAYKVARYNEHTVAALPAPLAFLADIQDYECELHQAFGAVTVTVRVVPDTDSQLGDDDVTGTFTDTASDTTIPNALGQRWHSLKYYEPAPFRTSEGIQGYRRRGMTKAQARAAYQRAVELDMAADLERRWVGIEVVFKVDLMTIAAESLWGIDVAPDSGTGYLIETAAELIDQAIDSGLGSYADQLKDAAARINLLVNANAELTQLSRRIG